MANASPRSKYFRIFLISVIAFSSISAAVMFTLMNSGLYKYEEPDYEGVAFKNIDVFVGDGTVLQDQTVIIRKDEIQCVGTDCEIPADFRIVDGTDLSLMPGLVDMQCGFYSLDVAQQQEGAFSQTLDLIKQHPSTRKDYQLAGVTSIRSVGDAIDNILLLRKQLQDKEFQGPRLFVAGPTLTAPEGYPAVLFQGDDYLTEQATRQISSTQEGIEQVQWMADNRVNGIRISYYEGKGEHPRIAAETLNALVKAANDRSLWVSVLTESNEEIQAAIGAGANMIEYGTDAELDSLTLSQLKASDVLYIPALKNHPTDPQRLENAEILYRDSVQLGIGAGAKTGGAFGSSLIEEMLELERIGMPAPEILQSATTTAARYLKSDHHLGLIKPRYLADLLIVKGAPWEEISALQNVQYVVQGGVIVVDQGKLVE
ncbi:amidohydrolase family protein [Pontibacter sp. G13]|uniref:amidohydrolase family protein n=1 Tax=Pontibacter sp. G13 TaxID=3074898 RepID=UPI00288B0F68|nr:amidohydrolase family protein [Pontibacter sp. G13]WNJ18653.1 amidohydrolase family protein [Pontibacter sp. G13]